MSYKPRPCNRCQDPFIPTTSNSQFCDTCREARIEEKRQAMIERQTQHLSSLRRNPVQRSPRAYPAFLPG